MKVFEFKPTKQCRRIAGQWLAAGVLSVLPVWAMAQNVTIGALVSGQVEKVNAQEGDSVKAGALLMEIDQQVYRAKLEAMQAEVKLRKLQLDDAKIELEQALDLFDRTVTARRTLDAAQLAHDVAEASLIKAQAQLKTQQAWGKYYRITAPFAAKVVKVYAPQGSTVFKENNPLIELQPQ